MKTMITRRLKLHSLICCAVAACMLSTCAGQAASTVSDQYNGLTSDRNAAQAVDYTVEPYQLFNGAAAETTLFTFPSNTMGGCYPTGTLLRDAAGALYGSTTGCVITQTNTVFRLTPPLPGQSAWRFTVLHSFTDGNDGGKPNANLVQGADGALYGTASYYGQFLQGVVFRLNPPPPRTDAMARDRPACFRLKLCLEQW